MEQIDGARFSEACTAVIGAERERNSVGLLAEKTVHAVLKRYYEPDLTYHEIKVGRFQVDVCRDGRVVEIQSRNFSGVRDKLLALVEEHPVTLVHPIPAAKYIVWVDPETGEFSPKRRVPRRGRFTDAGRELYSLYPLIGHPNFRVELLLMDMVEYRLRDGRGAERKRGSHRYDRFPLALVERCVLDTAASYRALIPADLPTPFTAKDFRRATAGGPRIAPSLLSLLCRLELVCRVGKAKNAYLYEVASTEEKNE